MLEPTVQLLYHANEQYHFFFIACQLFCYHFYYFKLEQFGLPKWAKLSWFLLGTPKKFQRMMICSGFSLHAAQRVWVKMDKWLSVMWKAVRFVISLKWFRKQGVTFLDAFTRTPLELPSAEDYLLFITGGAVSSMDSTLVHTGMAHSTSGFTSS